MLHFEDYDEFTGYSLTGNGLNEAVDKAAQEEVDKSKGEILAIVRGRHFVPGGISRNRRLYTEELWANVENDEEFMTRMKNKQVLGRFGHEAEINDMTVADGKFSHYTRNINFKTGEAESVILNTQMGRTLLTLLRAGVTLYVSSRADGDYIGQDDDGNDILAADTFKLERFDFVLDPGFLEAHPTMITESKNKGTTPINEKVSFLMNLACNMEVPLELDGTKYSVTDVDESRGTVHMRAHGGMTNEEYAMEEFKDSVQQIQESIFNGAVEIRKELNMLQYANSQGLDESHVRSQLEEGVSLGDIKPNSTSKFRIIGGSDVKVSEAVDQLPQPRAHSSSFLDRLFTGKLQ